MAEYDKYVRNVWKAEAIKDIAETLKNNIESCNRDISWYENRIEERMAELKEIESNPDEDWQIECNKKSIEQVKEKISLWNLLTKTIDKELAF